MPVSTGSYGEPRAKRCKLCDESNHRSESGSGCWQLQLDRDLVDTISAIYPEWFKNKMSDPGSPSGPRDSPPKAVIDSSPLVIDRNKESLKVKLMLRRPHDQLVAQGIMPPHKTPAFHGQRRQLERARTGDMLKAKIQQRPPRQELERRHILEPGLVHIDPSLVDKQRMLEKARLADQLNNQLSHRPGPLELIQKNILHTEEPIEQAVKTGQISYKATSEGQLNRPQHPQRYTTPEEDSQSSEGDTVSLGPSDMIETAAKSAGIVVIPSAEATVVVTRTVPILTKDTSEIVLADLCRSVKTPVLTQTSVSSPASLVSSTSTLSPLSSVASPVPSVVSQPTTPAPPMTLTPRPLPSPSKSDAPGKDKNRKKSKSKTSPKARTIKFHEYKGPPSAQKNNSNNGNSAPESSYDLLLQQQTLLLQFQLALQHKYPQIILPASQKASVEPNNNVSSVINNSNISSNPSISPSISSESSLPIKLSGRLEDMKVSDLKVELKRRSLPVSGSKPQLIERLKPYTGNNEIVNQNIPSVESAVPSNSNMEHPHNSPQHQDIGSPKSSVKEEPQEQMDISEPLSPMPSQQNQEINVINQDDIVREQQRKIEELQRELTLSQLKLQAATRGEPKAELLQHLQAKQNQQIVLQMQQLQALQARQAQVDEQQQRLQHVAFQNKNITGGLVLNGVDAALVLQLVQDRAKVLNGHNKTNSLPNFFSCNTAPLIQRPEMKPDYTQDIESEYNDIKQPPLYEEATKQLHKKNNIKSQIVDDVLEILIKNGELPPSAAQDPSTPGSTGIRSSEPIFPPNNTSNCNIDLNSPEVVLELNPNELLESLDNLDNMDFSQLVMELGGNGHQVDNNNVPKEQHNLSVPMDTDEWLESLLPSENGHCDTNGSYSVHLGSQDSNNGNYDPVLAITQEPFDPFSLEDFRSPPDLTAPLSWDKVDFTV